MKYLVKTTNRAALEATTGIEKVGKATALPEFLLVTSVLSASSIRKIEGVTMVEEDGQATVEDMPIGQQVNQAAPPQWALGWISNSGEYW